jgi:hypothetical protein
MHLAVEEGIVLCGRKVQFSKLSEDESERDDLRQDMTVQWG